MGAIGGKLQKGKFEAKAFARDSVLTGAGKFTTQTVPVSGSPGTFTPATGADYLAGSANYKH